MRINRRDAIAATAGLPFLSKTARGQSMSSLTTIALLHLAPSAGEIDGNMQAIEHAVVRAAGAGAKLVLCPELGLSGYGFRDRIGTAWIAQRQEHLRAWADNLSRRTSVFLAIGTPEAAEDEGRFFNSLFVHSPEGAIVGRHRKIAALRVGAESWSSPGDRATVVALEGVGRIGLTICADMHSERLVRETVAPGVDLILSAAAWAEGEHGPAGEWERASKMSGRPVLVCNRTGVDVLDFATARSVVAMGGAIVHAHASAEPTIVLADLSRSANSVTNWRTISAASS